MFAQTLSLHWKSAKWFMLPLVLLCFGVPQLAARIGEVLMTDPYGGGAATYMRAINRWVPLFPLLALLSGMAAALAAWSWDHKVNHIYPLSLPVSRRDYALLKIAAGATMLLLPTGAILAACLIVTFFYQVPEGLHVYTFAFTGRFLLASLIAYGLLFALASGTIRTTAYVLSGVILVVIFGTMLSTFLDRALLTSGMGTPLELLETALTGWAGPFAVFGGNWMFIDV